MAENVTSPDLIKLTADIVTAYVGHNSVPRGDLPLLIDTIHAALAKTAQGQTEEAPQVAFSPAVPVKKSVKPDYIICLEDGKRFKSLKRHLRTTFNMTPEQYRAKWDLPRDYPMVAPNYTKQRSELAKTFGLGQQRRKRTAAGEPVASAKPKRGAARPVASSAKIVAPAKGPRTKKTV